MNKELLKIRQRKYAIDDQEEEIEVRCVAAPVFDNNSACMAALALVGTIGQIREDNIDELARHVIEAAGRVL